MNPLDLANGAISRAIQRRNKMSGVDPIELLVPGPARGVYRVGKQVLEPMPAADGTLEAARQRGLVMTQYGPAF